MNYKYKNNPKTQPLFTAVVTFLLIIVSLAGLSPYACASDITTDDLNRLAEKLDARDVALEELYNKVVYYDFEWGTPEDYAKAFNDEAIELCIEASQYNDSRAMYLIGDMLREGYGVEPDNSMAMVWYRKAAEKGDANALVRIGDIYLLGSGVEQDFSLAVECYEKAAEKDNAYAIESLRFMYSQGMIVEKDVGESLELYEKSKSADRASLPVSEVTPEVYNKQTFSVTSKITGEALSSTENHAIGCYAITYPELSEGITIPYPEAEFPGGYTFHSTDSADDGIWYAFTTSSDEYDAVRYWNLLAQYGFNCTTETRLGTKKYYASASGMPQIIIKDNSAAVKRGRSIAVKLPYGYSFAMPGETEIRHFDVETAFYPNDYDHNKDRFTTCPVDSNEEIVKVVLSFKPDRYSEGTSYSLDDFLAQTPSVCNYSCNLFCTELSDGRYTSYDYALAEKDSYKNFEEIDVYILQNSNNKVAMHFYIKAVNQAGITFEIESISSFSGIGESSEIINGFDESGKCLNCDGSGKVKCRACNGEGEEECSLCRGSKSIVNGQGKKVLCHRCGGRGKSDCTRCVSGKRDCKVCGGKGYR